MTAASTGHPGTAVDTVRGLLVLLATIVLVIAGMKSFGSGTPTVPDVRGLTVVDARQELTIYRTWHVVIATVEAVDQSPEGRSLWPEADWTVVRTVPAPGDRWPDGTAVRLYVLPTAEGADSPSA